MLYVLSSIIQPVPPKYPNRTAIVQVLDGGRVPLVGEAASFDIQSAIGYTCGRIRAVSDNDEPPQYFSVPILS